MAGYVTRVSSFLYCLCFEDKLESTIMVPKMYSPMVWQLSGLSFSFEVYYLMHVSSRPPEKKVVIVNSLIYMQFLLEVTKYCPKGDPKNFLQHYSYRGS